MQGSLMFGLLALLSNADASPLLGSAPFMPKTLVDSSTFALLTRYAGFAASASKVPCNKPPFGSKVVGYVNINITDTQATVYKDDNAKEFILAIPGTASAQDYFTDFEFIPLPYFQTNLLSCTGCLVHSGFQAAWESADAASKALLTSGLDTNPDYKVTVAGYSLGGALAQLAFISLQTSGYPVVAGFTYGQPRVGNQAFADYTDMLSGASDTAAGIYHRTTHTFDGVPQLPPNITGFRHPRTEYFELDGPAGTPTAQSTYRCYGQEAVDCNLSQGMGFINKAHGGYSGINTTTPYCSS